MTTSFASIITPSGMNLLINGKPLSVPSDHPKWSDIITLINNKEYSKIVDIVNIRNTVRNWIGNSDFTLVNDRLQYRDKSFNEAVTTKILNMIDVGLDASALFNFLRKVYENPSKISQEELLLFCVANKFMIHEDGDIIAYKSVRNDYMDIYSGTILNEVGAIVQMTRGTVDDVRDRLCSTGLHFATFEYASTWHGQPNAKVMIMKINPKDVVSVPSDYHNQKARCCRYEVIAELENNTPLPPKEVYTNKDLGVSSTNDDVQERLDDVQERLDYLHNTFRDLENTSYELEDDLADLENEISSLFNLEAELEENDFSTTDVQTKIANVQNDIDAKQLEFDNVTEEIDKLYREIEELEYQMADEENHEDCCSSGECACDENTDECW